MAGFAVVAFGVLLTVASLFADPLALGMPGTGFGWKQMLGTVFGLLIAGAGGYILYHTPAASESDTNDEGADNA